MKAKKIEWVEFPSNFEWRGCIGEFEMANIILFNIPKQNYRAEIKSAFQNSKINRVYNTYLFDTVAEAKQWCQDQLDEFVNQIGEQQ